MTEAFGTHAWQTLGHVEQEQLTEGRLQAHYALQWLARVARAYIPAQPDDSHTSLRWDHDLGALVSRPLRDHSHLSLQISDLTLTLHSGRGTEHMQSLALTGHTDAQVRRWLGERLAAHGHDSKALDAPSPYEMPNHALAQGAAYNTSGTATALAGISACFADAETLLARMEKQMIEHKLATSSVCCWPHHFDLATLTTLPTQDPDTTGFVGSGLSPGDEYYAAPYFYVSVYPEPAPETLPALSTLGHWHTREFTAAILPVSRIWLAKDQAVETANFLQRAVDVALGLLR